MKRSERHHRQQTEYTLPLPPVLLIGSLLAAGFYGLILAGPLNLEILRRYCLGHPVAVASVSLFFVGMVGLVLKWLRASRQQRLIGRSGAALHRLAADGDEVGTAQRVDWLLESWRSEPAEVRSSWLGRRLEEALLLQQSRGRRHQLEADLKALAEQAADQQYESYALLRIIHWAMPMLGFLGTVLGISLTLGQLDTQLLATQQQEAMNQLTRGLYVAFDTTAIALMLTVTSMFVQFAVNRIELGLLERVNAEIEIACIRFLAVDPFDAQDSLIVPVREMAAELLASVRQLVVDQADIWARSIGESQRQWADWTHKLSAEIDVQMGAAVDESLSKHLAGLEALQEAGGRQIEGRLQQWQTTLSEQTRALHGHQKEMLRQTTTLQELVQSTAELKNLEVAIGENLQTIQQVGQLDGAVARIETASVCIGEAVAMLATSLERAGLLRGSPQRPRHTRQAESEGAGESILPLPGQPDSAHPGSVNPQSRGKAA